MSYPRKRALLACDFCRQRKRRCDGKKPVCGNCDEAEADCHYQDLPTQRLDSSIPTAISKRLEHIETLLQCHSETLASLKSASTTSVVDQTQEIPRKRASLSPSLTKVGFSHVDGLTERRLSSGSPGPLASLAAACATSPKLDPLPARGEPRLEIPPFTIPPSHHKSIDCLLGFPTIRSLVGQFPPDYFFRIESRRAARPTTGMDLNMSSLGLSVNMGLWGIRAELPYLNRDVTDLLVTTFFSVVHPCHPILDRESFFSMYESLLKTGLDLTPRSAICLVVLALGVVASQPVGTDVRQGDWAPGMEYFAPALRILASESMFGFGGDLLVIQGLVFSGVYFAHLALPLQSWKMIHMGGTYAHMLNTKYNCQSVMRANGSVNGYYPTDKGMGKRVRQACWSCFLIECDRLAEFNLPRSGIEDLINSMPLLKDGHPPDREQLCHIAEINIRQLLNRIHSNIYGAGSLRSDINGLEMPINSLLVISGELDYQLSVWYETMPDVIRPGLGIGTEGVSDDREKILRIRYYDAKQAIHRLFVLYVATFPERQAPPPPILEKAVVCLEACRLYLQNAGDILKKPSQYTWNLSHRSLTASLVLTIASLSPHMAHLVPDAVHLQQLLMDNIARWAAPASSFESIIWILADIMHKQQRLH